MFCVLEEEQLVLVGLAAAIEVVASAVAQLTSAVCLPRYQHSAQRFMYSTSFNPQNDLSVLTPYRVSKQIKHRDNINLRLYSCSMVTTE